MRGADRMLVPRNFLCGCPFYERMQKTPCDACDSRARARSARGALGVVALGLALLSALALSGLSVIPMVARANAAPTIVLTPKFTRIGAGLMIGDGRYVAITRTRGFTVTGTTVIDTRTGQRTHPLRSGCAPDLIGGTSILFLCDASLASTYYELYSIPSRRFQPLNVNPTVSADAFCDVVTITCDQPRGIGTRWISFQPMNYHAPQAYFFQNLATGAAETASPSRSQNVDLDSPALLAKLCPPTTEPPNPDPSQDEAAPSVAVDGKFVIAAGSDTDYLEQCESPRHRFLTERSDFVYSSCWSGLCPLPFSSHAVIWQTNPNSTNPRRLSSLSGYFLPSLHRFNLHVPDKVGVPGPLVLASRRLYVDGGQSVWSAPIPTTPPSARRPRKH